MNAAELTSKMVAAKSEMDDAMTQYRDAIAADADAYDLSKREQAKAYLRGREEMRERFGYSKPTVDEIRAWVDTETAVVQRDARMKDGLKRAAGMAVENARQYMSALQSLAAAQRSEAQFEAYLPREVAQP